MRTDIQFDDTALSLEAKNEKLKKAIAVATGHTMVPSEMLIQELRSLTCTQPNHQVNYGELMQVKALTSLYI